MYTIGTNVCPVVGRLVDCASNHEITLRYRNPVTTTLTGFRHPSRALADVTLSPFRNFISCWNSYRDLTIIHFHKEVSKNFGLASSILHLLMKIARIHLSRFSFHSWRKFQNRIGISSLHCLFYLEPINRECKLFKLTPKLFLDFGMPLLIAALHCFCKFLSWRNCYCERSWYTEVLLFSTRQYFAW